MSGWLGVSLALVYLACAAALMFLGVLIFREARDAFDGVDRWVTRFAGVCFCLAGVVSLMLLFAPP